MELGKMLQVGIDPCRRQNASVLFNKGNQTKKKMGMPSLGIEGG